MAQAKLDVPEKSGGGVKEKDKDSEEKEGAYLSVATFQRESLLSLGKLYFIGCVLFGVFTTLVKLFILVYQIFKDKWCSRVSFPSRSYIIIIMCVK